ncbi:MAG: tetratricopeptide repeat protein [Nitrosomonadaceae bacterium]
MLRKVLTLHLVFALLPYAQADYESATAAYGAGDYEIALEIFLPLAEAGDAEAQTNLGIMYRNGFGVQQDYAEAIKWFHQAAEQGFADAQRHLARMYFRGVGVSQNYTEAFQWYQRAAEQGYADSQYNIGGMYEQGLGTDRDFIKAYAWLSLAVRGRIGDAIGYLLVLSEKMTDTEITAGQALALELEDTYGSRQAGAE